jgi:hypothetical protein
MIDDVLEGLFGEYLRSRVPHSKRAELLTRVFFGLLGAGLGLAGAWYFAARADVGGRVTMRATMILTFLFMSCFWLFNVALLRTWRWPMVMTAGSFIATILVRLIIG